MKTIKLKKLPEVTSYSDLVPGTVYRLHGQFHVEPSPGVLTACLHWTVAGMYRGPHAARPGCFVFADADGLRYVVTSPALTLGIVTTQIFTFAPAKKRAKRRAA